jgi:hypothetical protein
MMRPCPSVNRTTMPAIAVTVSTPVNNGTGQAKTSTSRAAVSARWQHGARYPASQRTFAVHTASGIPDPAEHPPHLLIRLRRNREHLRVALTDPLVRAHVDHHARDQATRRT